jgi:hypothetical protein
MAKEEAGQKPATPPTGQPGAEGQGAQQEVRLRIDERNLTTSYANAFRTDATAEEVLLYFGLNLVNPVSAQQGQAEFIFQSNQRIIMNYYMAKRLALTLGQLIRRHEEQFGELELDVSKRRTQK